MKPNKDIKHKVNFLVEEKTWLKLNQLLNDDIIKERVHPRTSFSEYLRQIIKKYLDERYSSL